MGEQLLGNGDTEEWGWTGGADPGRDQSLGLMGLGHIGFCLGGGPSGGVEEEAGALTAPECVRAARPLVYADVGNGSVVPPGAWLSLWVRLCMLGAGARVGNGLQEGEGALHLAPSSCSQEQAPGDPGGSPSQAPAQGPSASLRGSPLSGVFPGPLYWVGPAVAV